MKQESTLYKVGENVLSGSGPGLCLVQFQVWAPCKSAKYSSRQQCPGNQKIGASCNRLRVYSLGGQAWLAAMGTLRVYVLPATCPNL